MISPSAEEALRVAAGAVGIDTRGAQLVRSGENTLYRLPGGVIARISRAGQLAAARRELRVARWLAECGIAAVCPVEDLEQPGEVDERAVTFWRELPAHSPGTPRQVARLLRRLHALAAPTALALPALDPFVRIRDRLDTPSAIPDDDRRWLLARLDGLRASYARLPAALPFGPVHGDAWTGNVVATHDGTVLLLDLERFSVGPPEWDLVSTAIRWTSFGTLAAQDYRDFADAYGTDVTRWPGYAILRDIRELRVVAFAVQQSTERPDVLGQARHRIACVRGLRGPRPWPGWRALP